MTVLNAASSWNVGHVSRSCAGCGAALSPHAICWAALCEGGGGQAEGQGKVQSPFMRADYCGDCWVGGKRPAEPLEMFSYWKTTVPEPAEKKKLLVDDSVLMDLFARMEDKSQDQEVRFRFVLALILMRKRLLKYEGMEVTPTTNHESRTTNHVTPEIWRMIPKWAAEGTAVRVINPHLTAEQIAEVSQQLSSILAEEV